jgi:hypothetical protein
LAHSDLGPCLGVLSAKLGALRDAGIAGAGSSMSFGPINETKASLEETSHPNRPAQKIEELDNPARKAASCTRLRAEC